MTPLTVWQFTEVLLMAFWPLIIVGLIGTLLLVRDIIKHFRKGVHYVAIRQERS